MLLVTDHRPKKEKHMFKKILIIVCMITLLFFIPRNRLKYWIRYAQRAILKKGHPFVSGQWSAFPFSSTSPNRSSSKATDLLDRRAHPGSVARGRRNGPRAYRVANVENVEKPHDKGMTVGYAEKMGILKQDGCGSKLGDLGGRGCTEYYDKNITHGRLVTMT